MPVTGETKSKLNLIRYTLSHAPWAFITSLSMGLSHYVIIILVAKYYNLEEAGQFRLLLATFGILGLLTLMDSGKVLVKYLVQTQVGVVRTLFLQRMRWSLAALAIGAGLAGWYYWKGDEVWLPLLIASVCLPIANPASLYIQINQAQKKFRLNAFYAVAKVGLGNSWPFFVFSLLQFNVAWSLECIFHFSCCLQSCVPDPA